MRTTKTSHCYPWSRRRKEAQPWLYSAVLFRLRPRLEVMEDRTVLSAFLVTTTADSGSGSLRAAILLANGTTGSGAVIDFAIPGVGAQTIEPVTPLPAITGSVLIDGTSQPGYAGDPLIEINGSAAGGGNGLTITGSGSTVRGLAIDGFTSGAAIVIDGAQASGNAIYGNELGTNAIDPLAEGNLHGVEALNGAYDNDIGSNSLGNANTISGNSGTGVLLTGESVAASQGFGASAGDLTLNGSATFAGSRLQLTDGVQYSASAFTSQPVDVSDFQTQFTFQLADPANGDLTFTIQNQSPNLPDFEGAGQSVTVDFDLNPLSYSGQFTNTTSLELDGAIPGIYGFINLNGSGIDLRSGDVFQANLSYDGEGLSVTITDTDTGASTTEVYSVDIPGTVGSSTAYVGFTADSWSETGGAITAASVLGWSYLSAAGVTGNRVADNVITNNGGPGVAVIGAGSTANTLSGNIIAGNSGPAIDESGAGAAGLPKAPIIITTTDGKLEGWLPSGQPDTTYELDFFASAAYSADGSGEAQDHLGSLSVATDSQGQAAFDEPFTPPGDLPIVTATATDPEGDTSEVSGLRAGTLVVPAAGYRITPGQPLVFSSSSGASLALQDPDAGPFGSTWSVTISVPLGSLSFYQGAPAGTRDIEIQGTLALINTLLAHLVFTPPPGFDGNTTLSVTATSAGAATIQASINVTDGIFVVTSAADGGPGSLRQAIVDSNSVGGTNTIAFALPGNWFHTIVVGSPLPEATTPTLIDGSTQPGFAGSPVVALENLWPGATGGLDVVGSLITVRSLVISGYAFGTDGLPESLTIASPSTLTSQSQSGWYPIDLTTDSRLVARVSALGVMTQLALLDSYGNVLLESAGQGPGNPTPLIDQDLNTGKYYLAVRITSGAGEYDLNASAEPYSVSFNDTVGNAQSASMVVGDFNGDGIPDIAMLDGVHLGNGDGTFRSPLSGLGLPPGDEYGNLLAGDFFGDGKLDLVVYDYTTNELLMVKGNGDGTFQANTIYVLGNFHVDYGIDTVVAGDFNNDGKLDLALDESSSGTIEVLLGNGNGTFQTPKVSQLFFHVLSDLGPMVAGDFNNDGKLDLAIADLQGTIDVFLGNGNGTFSTPGFVVPLVTSAGLDIRSLVAGDFNGDGNLDLAATSQADANVEVFLGKGDGTFARAVDFPIMFIDKPIHVGDFNGDGKLDLLLSGGSGQGTFDSGDDQNEGFIWLLTGNGDGTFQSPQIVEQFVSSVLGFGLAIGDFTGGGRIDMVAAVYPTGLIFMRGNGDGTFEDPVAAPTDTIPSTLALGDFTGDGTIDMAVASSVLGSITILLGDGDGGYTIGQQISLGNVSEVGTPVVGDFNGDGRLDLALVVIGPGVPRPSYPSSLVILFGNGDGTFQIKIIPFPQVTLPPGTSNDINTELAIGDFNGDGRPDLLSIGEDGRPVLWLGNGDGTFRTEEVNTPYVSSIVVGDFAGNGILDFAAEYFPTYDTDVMDIYLGNGHGGFTLVQTIASAGPPLLAGDFNGDGKVDLLTSGAIYLGNGNGTFDPAGIAGPPDAGGPVVAGDFTGNGKLDLATLLGEGVAITLGNGDGNFQPPEIVDPLTTFTTLTLGDVNGDGRPDLVLTNLDTGTITTLLNNGDGTFSPAGEVVANTQDTPLVVEANNDGTPDALVVDGSGDILYRQGNPLSPGSFLPPVIINVGFPSRDIAWVPNTLEGPLLASVDAQDNAVSLYAYRDGGFVRVGSLASGQIPAQVVVADLNGDGWDDLVVRNAGDGTLSLFLNNGNGSAQTGFVDPFLSPATIEVGPGIGDLQAIDTTGDGEPDLVVTNEITGQVSVLLNQGNGSFGSPVPYRAGVSSSAYDASSAAVQIKSLELTAGVAGESPEPGGPMNLVAANPGSSTIDLLQSLGGGNFANPTVLLGSIKATVICAADFNDDGVTDLAVLDSHGVTVLLGNGKGGFLPPVTYAAGLDPTGLSVADVNDDGKLDLIVGNRYGDILVLLNQGDGTFAPYRNADQTITLAVADLTGNGQKDIIYADQSLDRVVVDYGDGNSSVLGDQSSGLLSPGAVLLADLNGDGIPDLIVANSGSNNVLVYPGLGNGQFGPAVNDGHGFFTGTDPIGLYVADLTGNGTPDLVVANAGSNNVSVLLGEGIGASWTMVAGPRIKTDAGPVAVAVGNFLGTGQLDLAVANQEANNVEVLPSVGNGFFNDTAPTTYAVGQAPSGLFLGDFDGSGTSIATLNAGSNTLSLINSSGVVQTLPAGGLRPSSGFEGDFTGSGFTDLVVGDSGDGRFTLFTGGPNGLSLSQTISSPDVPSPTSLSFAGVTDGLLSFYASTAGVESATLLAFNLSDEASATGSGSVSGEGLAPATEQSAGPVLASATTGLFQQVAQFLNLTGSALDLVAPIFTVSVIGGEFGSGSPEGGGVALLASFGPATVSATLGQAVLPHADGPDDEDPPQAQAPAMANAQTVREDRSPLPLWERVSMGLERAWEQIRSTVIEKGGAEPDIAEPVLKVPALSAPTEPARGRSSEGVGFKRGQSIDKHGSKASMTGAALQDLLAEYDAAGRAGGAASVDWDKVIAIHYGPPRGPAATTALVSAAAIIGTYVKSDRWGRARPHKRRKTSDLSAHRAVK